jgi:hypothetical protein
LGITRRLLIQGMSAAGLGWLVGCDDSTTTHLTDSSKAPDTGHPDLPPEVGTPWPEQGPPDTIAPDQQAPDKMVADAPYGSYGGWLLRPGLRRRRLAGTNPWQEDPGFSVEWMEGGRPRVLERLARWLSRKA